MNAKNVSGRAQGRCVKTVWMVLSSVACCSAFCNKWVWVSASLLSWCFKCFNSDLKATMGWCLSIWFSGGFINVQVPRAPKKSWLILSGVFSSTDTLWQNLDYWSDVLRVYSPVNGYCSASVSSGIVFCSFWYALWRKRNIFAPFGFPGAEWWDDSLKILHFGPKNPAMSDSANPSSKTASELDSGAPK